MTNEDAIKFILESQSRQAEYLERIEVSIQGLAAHEKEQDTLLTNLTQASFNTIGALSGRINELAEQGRKTDERISAVVNMVEKWIAEDQRRRNGNTK
jgi:hypothetical protein